MVLSIIEEIQVIELEQGRGEDGGTKIGAAETVSSSPSLT